MQLHRRFLALAATATLLAGASACGDGEQAEPAPSAAATTTAPATSEPAPSTTAPPARPDVPAPDPADFPGKDERTEEGAQQAFRYFWAVLTWAYQTGETEAFVELYTDSCTACTTNLRSMEELEDMGEYWSVSSITDQSLGLVDPDLNRPRVGYVFTLGAHTEPLRENSKRDERPDVEYATVGTLAWTGDSWVVETFDLGSAPEGATDAP